MNSCREEGTSGSRPRILYIITLAEFGGAQTHLLDLLAGFRDRYDVHLATSADGPLTEAARTIGVSVHLLPSLGRAISPLGDLRAIGECARTIRSVAPSLVHLHSSKAGLVGRIAARLVGIPAIFTAHGWGFKPGVPARRRYLVWVSEVVFAPLARRIICVSAYDHELAIRAKVGSTRLVQIHNGLSPAAPLATTGAEPPDIIMTARFHEPKDQDLLLRTFAACDAPGATLTFIGDGAGLAATRDLATTLGLAGRVRFLGDRPDVAELLAKSQIFVLLSRYEGLPISILEAMRAGLPVVASGVGGIPELVADGVTGFIVPPGDMGATTTALRALLGDPALRRQFGEAGRRRFADDFTAARMLERTAEVYESVLARAPARAARRATDARTVLSGEGCGDAGYIGTVPSPD